MRTTTVRVVCPFLGNQGAWTLDIEIWFWYPWSLVKNILYKTIIVGYDDKNVVPYFYFYLKYCKILNEIRLMHFGLCLLVGR